MRSARVEDTMDHTINMRNYGLVTIGHGSATGYHRPREGYGRCTTSGWESVWREAPIGTLVLDLRPALPVDTDHAVALQRSVNSPMLDLRIHAGDVARCPEPDPVMVAGLRGAYHSLAARRVADPQWTGLDSVGIDDYIAYWRALGARLGRSTGTGEIDWDDPESRDGR